MLVGEQDAIEFVRRDSALGETENELARAQPAIDEQPAMIGRDQRAVPRAAAPEHRQTKHFRLLAKRSTSAQTETGQLRSVRSIFDSDGGVGYVCDDGRDRPGRSPARLRNAGIAPSRPAPRSDRAIRHLVFDRGQFRAAGCQCHQSRHRDTRMANPRRGSFF